MSHIKFRMSQLHKTWKQAKDDAPKLAKQRKDGNAELALKDLYKNKFRSGLGDKLDQLSKDARNVQAAQTATLAKPSNKKLYEKWVKAVAQLRDSLLQTHDIIKDYERKVDDEEDELGEVYAFLKEKLASLEESIAHLVGGTKTYQSELETAVQKTIELYRSVELNIRKSRSLTDSELLDYLSINVDPRVAGSFPTLEFDL